jgi:hypothetical protein
MSGVGSANKENPMSEPLGPTGGDGFGGPASRPDGGGVPPGAGKGGFTPGEVAGGDERDPGMAGEGDIGQDTGGMLGEG